MNEALKLHEETLFVVRSYQKNEKEIISLLLKNHVTFAFRTLGYSSLHVYCTRALGLSDAVAYSLGAIAKKSLAIPEIKSLIDSEKLHISNATQIIRSITPENKAELLETAQKLSKRDLEKELKRRNPEVIPKDRVRVLNHELEEVKFVRNQFTKDI